MAIIKLENITTPYCLKKINLKIEPGELVVLLGSTGAGKSSLLNVIAGLIQYQGIVYYNNININNLPPEERKVGYLLQDIYLFPHLNAFDNIAFGLKAAKTPRGIIEQKVNEIMELLNISHLQKRLPKDLSGGEKQRIGLARSLGREPEMLLLDEPLSSLDPSTAKSIRKELIRLHRSLNLTTLYVTHNFAEARFLADKIAVIDQGELKQMGSAKEIFNQPAKEIEKFIKAEGL